MCGIKSYQLSRLIGKALLLVALFCFPSFLFAQTSSYENKYLITETELNQILSECDSLNLQIVNLQSLQASGKQQLQTLNDQLGALKQENANETALLTQSQGQLEALSKLLKKSKLEALKTNIVVGGICLSVGVGIGVIIGLATK